MKIHFYKSQNIGSGRILTQSCIRSRPFLVNTYKDLSYTHLSNFTFTLVKDEGGNPEIRNYLANSLNRKGYFEDNLNYDGCVSKVYTEKFKLTDVDFVSRGNVLSKKFSSGKSVVIQIMDAKTKEFFYRGTCSGLPHFISKSQLKAIVNQTLRNLNEASSEQLSFRKN